MYKGVNFYISVYKIAFVISKQFIYMVSHNYFTPNFTFKLPSIS